MAQRIPEETVDYIREETNILDIVSQYVDLQKRGQNYFGFCPFHDERTPSFSVSENKQIFHCFSCGRGGNAYRFLMDLEGYSFPEAVKKVAELGNVSTDYDWNQLNQSSKQSMFTESQEKSLTIHQQLTEYYHYILTTTKAGQSGMDYLEKRGLSLDTIRTYRIGVAPNDGEITANFLRNQGFTDDELVNSGVFSGVSERLHDRFRGRIVFPLSNERGNVCGFSGRLFTDGDDQQPKYLNSPETDIFHKREFLFNLNIAKEDVRKAKEFVLYEGFMDVISAANIGLKNGIASMGTSLTAEQIQKLNHYTKQIVIAYDGDQPGQKATKRAIELIHEEKPSLKQMVLQFPNQLDPDEFIQHYGGDRYRQFVSEQRVSIIHFYRNYYKQLYSLDDDQGKVDYTNKMLQVVNQQVSPLEQAVAINDISADTGINEEVLNEQLAAMPENGSNNSEITSHSPVTFNQTINQPTEKNYSLTQKSELVLLNRLFYHQELIDVLPELVTNFHFDTPIMETIYLLWQEYVNANENPNPEEFLQTLTGQEEQSKVVEAMTIDLPKEVSEREISDLVFHIVTESDLNQQLAAIDKQLAVAKSLDDFAQLSDLNMKKIEIMKQLKNKK